MGRPPIQDNYAERFGTLHSVTVRRVASGKFQALARLCYLTDSGDWEWVNRRAEGDTPEHARQVIEERVTLILGCRSQAETNRLTKGLHRGHKHVADVSVLHR